jgi:hypothetical protein
MFIGIPQLIYLVLIIFSLSASIINHGKQHGKENALVSFITVVLQVALLWWGGFFG